MAKLLNNMIMSVLTGSILLGGTAGAPLVLADEQGSQQDVQGEELPAFYGGAAAAFEEEIFLEGGPLLQMGGAALDLGDELNCSDFSVELFSEKESEEEQPETLSQNAAVSENTAVSENSLSPTVTPSPIPTATPTPTAAPTATPTPLPTATPTPLPTATPTPSPEPTPTEEPTPAPTEEVQPTQEPTPTEAAVDGSELGAQLAAYACQFVGNPYVYGGVSLTNGADCSGFVMSVYAQFGVSLPHSSESQRSVGAEVEGGIAAARAGDIICYNGHVAIYIGNGQIVHAFNSRKGIVITEAGYDTILSIRRIFE